MKQCRHCDIMSLRPDDTPIPDDACTRCHEEVEALVRKSSVKEGIKKYWVMNGLTWKDFKRTIRGE